MMYRVGTFRDAGLEAKWSKTRAGQPCIVVRDPLGVSKHQRETWWLCDSKMFDAMKTRGIRKAFDECTCMGDIFSIPA